MSQRKDTGLNTNPWPKLVDHDSSLVGCLRFMKPDSGKRLSRKALGTNANPLA